jgi:hypothetical protein
LFDRVILEVSASVAKEKVNVSTGFAGATFPWVASNPGLKAGVSMLSRWKLRYHVLEERIFI